MVLDHSLKKVLTVFTGLVGYYGSYITIKDEWNKKKELERLNQIIQELRSQNILNDYNKNVENKGKFNIFR